MKILTCRQPWAHLITSGAKDIENRSKITRYRGPILIHAAKAVEWAEYDVLYSLGICPYEPVTGGIIGICELVDVVEKSSSRWFQGTLWMGANQIKTPPVRPDEGSAWVS
jgi:hypothetical protein